MQNRMSVRIQKINKGDGYPVMKKECIKNNSDVDWRKQ